ncbi:MAG: nitroreductase family protein [Mogibacterium sp.]|nr:nitroreductase family protein [Mogibacterium sp.]MBQ6500501.1 nitroreductase family protein [Mogibacterium sp.]
MNPIIINEEKCIGCELCAKDCPSSYLYIENGKAHTKTGGCLECGHCYAICPQGAIRLLNYDCKDEAAVPMTELPSDTLLAAMKSRRTVRQFTDQAVEPEKIQKILEAGRYSPTGGNSQNVSYTILGSRQNEAEAICIDLFRKGTSLPRRSKAFAERFNITDNFFFKGAPLVILVSSRSLVDGGLASSYMELMAESLGLGVLYSGFFVMCTRISRKLRKLIRLPKGHKVVTCMVIGYPAVKYHRIVPRKPLQSRTL